MTVKDNVDNKHITSQNQQESQIKWALASHLEIGYFRKTKHILMIENRCESLNGEVNLLMAEKT